MELKLKHQTSIVSSVSSLFFILFILLLLVSFFCWCYYPYTSRNPVGIIIRGGEVILL